MYLAYIMRFMGTCLELANDFGFACFVIVRFVRAYVRRGWLLPRSIRAISLVYYVPLYVVQTRGGWLRAARSIPKVALAYRLQHARAARVYLERRGACAHVFLPYGRTRKPFSVARVRVSTSARIHPRFQGMFRGRCGISIIPRKRIHVCLFDCTKLR